MRAGKCLLIEDNISKFDWAGLFNVTLSSEFTIN